MNKEEVEFFSELSAMLQSYIDESPNSRSYRQLAKKTGVSATSIARYAQNELDNKPVNEKVFNLLKELTGNVETAAIKMKNAYPTWWNGMGKHLSNDQDLNNTLSNIDLTRNHCEILYQSYEDDGVFLSWINERFGSKGKDLLEELVTASYLYFDDALQAYVANNKKENNITRALAQTVALGSNLKHDIDGDVDFNDRNAASFYYWLKLDSNGLKRFKDEYNRFWSIVDSLEDEYNETSLDKQFVIKVGAIRETTKKIKGDDK